MKLPIIILILSLIILTGCSDLNNTPNDSQSSTISEKQEYSGPSQLVIGKKIDINKNIKAGNFEITLNKYLVDPKWQIYDDSDETDSVAYFYFTIKNTGTKEEQFYPQDIALITDNNRQLSETFDSTFRMKTFYSGVKEEMDLYFEALQKDEKPKTLKFKIGDFSKYSIYEYNLNSNQASVSDFVRCNDGEYRKSEDACNSAKKEIEDKQKQEEEKQQQDRLDSYKCEDGTAHETCSKDKPKYCSYGKLSDRADKCNCPEGFEKEGYLSCKKIDTTPATVEITTGSYSANGLKFEIDLAEHGNKISYKDLAGETQSAGAQTDKKLLKFEITVTSVDGTKSFYGSNFMLMDTEGNTYDAQCPIDYFQNCRNADNLGGMYDPLAGQKKTGSLMFQIPLNVKKVYLVYKFSTYDNKPNALKFVFNGI